MNRDQILNEAAKCVCQSRSEQYGPIEDNFAAIAGLWSTWLGAKRAKHAGRVEFEATDVAMMLALVKVARQATSPGHADNYVDLAGYAACGGEIATKESSAADQQADVKAWAKTQAEWMNPKPVNWFTIGANPEAPTVDILDEEEEEFLEAIDRWVSERRAAAGG